MKSRIAVLACALLLSSCSSSPAETATPDGAEDVVVHLNNETSALAFDEPATTSSLPAVSDPDCVLAEPVSSAIEALQALAPTDTPEGVEASFRLVIEEVSRLAAEGPSELTEGSLLLQLTYEELAVLWESQAWAYDVVINDSVIAAEVEALSTWRVIRAQEGLTEWVVDNCDTPSR